MPNEQKQSVKLHWQKKNPGNYTRAISYGAAKYVKKVDYDKETGEILTASSGLDIDEDKIREEEITGWLLHALNQRNGDI